MYDRNLVSSIPCSTCAFRVPHGQVPHVLYEHNPSGNQEGVVLLLLLLSLSLLLLLLLLLLW